MYLQFSKNKQQDSTLKTKPYDKSTPKVQTQQCPQDFLFYGLGNQAIQRLYKSGVIQAKLQIGEPNDKYEEEADRVAEQVMRMPEPSLGKQQQIEEKTQDSMIQCKCSNCTKDGEHTQKKDSSAEGVASDTFKYIPPIVHNVLRSTGQLLDPTTRAFFETRFDRDFSQVRVHIDTKAAKSAQMLDAQAYTFGQQIVFAKEQFAPGTSSGQKLLAHELVHTTQQQDHNNDLNNNFLMCSPQVGKKTSSGPLPATNFVSWLDRIGESMRLEAKIARYLESSIKFIQEHKKENWWGSWPGVKPESFASIVYNEFLGMILSELEGRKIIGEIHMIDLLMGNMPTHHGGFGLPTYITSEDFEALPVIAKKDLKELEGMLMGIVIYTRKKFRGPKEMIVIPRSGLLEESFREAGEHMGEPPSLKPLDLP